MQTTKRPRPWSETCHHSFGMLPLGPSITQCPMGGGCLTMPYPCSFQKCARPSSMSTKVRWWSVPPLLRNGVPSPLTNSRRGETSPIHVVHFDGKRVNCKCPPNSGFLYNRVLLRCTHDARWCWLQINLGRHWSAVWDQHQTLKCRPTMHQRWRNA